MPRVGPASHFTTWGYGQAYAWLYVCRAKVELCEHEHTQYMYTTRDPIQVDTRPAALLPTPCYLSVSLSPSSVAARHTWPEPPVLVEAAAASVD